MTAPRNGTAAASDPSLVAAPPTAVVYDARDVSRLFAQDIAFASVLPLSPSARAAISKQSTDIALHQPRLSFTDDQYADAVRTVDRERQAAQAALDRSSQLSEGTRWTLLYTYQSVANAALRLWITIDGKGPWIVPNGTSFTEVVDKEQAQELLVRHLCKRLQIGSVWYEYESPPMPGLFRLLRGVTLRLMRSPAPSIVTQRTAHPFGLHKMLSGERVRRYHISGADAGWREYLRLAREMWRAWRGRDLIQIRVISSNQNNRLAEQAVDGTIAAIGEPVIREAMRHLRDDLIWTAKLIDGIVEDMVDVVGRIRPDVFVACEISDAFTAGLADACGHAAVPRLIMSHNSHTPGQNATDDLAMGALMTTQYWPALADEYAVWTPVAATAARRYLAPKDGPLIRPVDRPLEVRPDRSSPRKASDGLRRVLQAGNSARWFRHFPWIFETSDEFLDGLSALIAAMASVPQSRLVVRTKGKLEQDHQTLRTLLTDNGTWELKARQDSPFAADLANADLLVAIMSSTIMQALHSRTPVLLWGGTLRYRHLPARTKPPVAGDRAAIYTVESADELAPMITAILDAHAGQPLTDEEVSDYVWQVDVPDMQRLALAIAEGDYRRAWATPEGVTA